MGNVDVRSESILYKVKNQDYKGQIENYIRWFDLFKGGDRVERRQEYLPRHPFESEDQYNIRIDRSAYRNFAAPISSVFSSSVLRIEPDRKNLPFDKDLMKNVDRKGNPADAFFKNMIDEAAYMGVSFVLVDSTRAPDGVQPKTVKDFRQYEIRPYFIRISPFNLIDWDYSVDDTNGKINLEFIVIKDILPIGEREPFKEIQYKNIARLWTRNEWLVLEEDSTSEDGMSVVIDETTKVPLEGKHGLGIVPLVPFYFQKKAELVGDSSFSSVDTQILKVYRKDSELDKAEFDSAVEILFGRGISKKDADGFIKSSSAGFFTDNPDASMSYIAPSGIAFDALRKSISDSERHIRETALRMIRPDSKVGESAESKMIDRDQLTSMMVSFAFNCELAERRCWDLFSLWQGNGEIPEENQVSYNMNLDPGFAAELFMESINDLVLNKVLSKDTVRRILPKTRIPLPDDFDATTEALVVQKESYDDTV